MPKSNNAAPAEETALARPEGRAIVQFKALLATLPTINDDPTEPMIEAILASQDPSQWETIFTAASFKDNAGQQVRVNAIRANESQFEGRFPVYLLLDVTDLRSGVRGVMTCGSEMAMAQLVNAWSRDLLPIDVEIFRKPNPTKAGFYPMRLKYLGKPGSPLGDPAAVVSEQ